MGTRTHVCTLERGADRIMEHFVRADFGDSGSSMKGKIIAGRVCRKNSNRTCGD